MHEAISEKLGLDLELEWQTLLKGTEKLAWEVPISDLVSPDCDTLHLTLVIAEAPDPEPGALRAAIEAKDAALCLRLLRRKHLPGLNDSDDSTVLDVAIWRKLPEVALAIVAREDFTEINAEFQFDDGGTALHFAAYQGYLSVCQAIVNRTDFTALLAHCGGHTARQYADRQGFKGGMTRELRPIVDFLLGIEAKTREPDELWLDIFQQEWGCTEQLLHWPSPPGLNDVDADGCTRLHAAIRHHHPRWSVAVAIVARPDFAWINAKDPDGRTALHLAVEGARRFVKTWGRFHWHPQEVLALCGAILSRADFTELQALNLHGESAQQLATRLEQHEVAEFLQEAAEEATSADPGALLAAIEQQDEALALELLQQPRLRGLNIIGRHGNTVLHTAAYHGLEKVALSILSKPSFVGINLRNRWGCSTLHVAAAAGSLPVCRAILGHGHFDGQLTWRCDDIYSELPTNFAREEGYHEVANFLKDASSAFERTSRLDRMKELQRLNSR